MQDRITPATKIQLIEDATDARFMNQQEAERLKIAEEKARRRLETEKQLAHARAQVLITTNQRN